MWSRQCLGGSGLDNGAPPTGGTLSMMACVFSLTLDGDYNISATYFIVGGLTISGKDVIIVRDSTMHQF